MSEEDSDVRVVLAALDQVLPRLEKCIPRISQGPCDRPWMVWRLPVGMSPPEYRCDEHGPEVNRGEWSDAPWAAAVRAAAKVRAKLAPPPNG